MRIVHDRGLRLSLLLLIPFLSYVLLLLVPYVVLCYRLTLDSVVATLIAILLLSGVSFVIAYTLDVLVDVVRSIVEVRST